MLFLGNQGAAPSLGSRSLGSWTPGSSLSPQICLGAEQNHLASFLGLKDLAGLLAADETG